MYDEYLLLIKTIPKTIESNFETWTDNYPINCLNTLFLTTKHVIVTHVRHLSMKSTKRASVDLSAAGRGRLPGRLRRPLVFVMLRGFPRESAGSNGK